MYICDGTDVQYGFRNIRHFHKTKVNRLSIDVDQKSSLATELSILHVLPISGDVSPNPGPIKCPCGKCSKSVRSNQKAILCDKCNNWFHAKCMDINTAQYNKLSVCDDEWYCDT